MTDTVVLSWSSGKDSAWALGELVASEAVEVVALVTTVSEAHRRVAMHAVRTALLECQAQATGLPLVQLAIPSPCSNAQYEAIMRDYFARARAEGVTAIAYADLFLTDVRAYRERLMADSGLEPLFPLWGRDTRALARQMVDGGLRAYLTCVDPRQLPARFAGRRFDEALLEDLPAGVDPCGERGEFHTFVYAAPVLSAPLEVVVGEIVERDGFVFADVLPLTPDPREAGRGARNRHCRRKEGNASSERS